MTSFTFPFPGGDSDEPTASQQALAHANLRKCVLSIQESFKAAKEEDKRQSEKWNQIITFRMPNEMLNRLDTVAADAATTRGFLIRQIIATYLSYVAEHSVTYNGSLI